MNQEREQIAQIEIDAGRKLADWLREREDTNYAALVDRLTSAAELALRSGGEGWRPISEAPRDGTHIILAFGQDHACEGWFLDDDNEPRPWAFIDIGDNNVVVINRSRDGEYGPSHWQPMPYREPRNRPSPSTHGEG